VKDHQSQPPVKHAQRCEQRGTERHVPIVPLRRVGCESASAGCRCRRPADGAAPRFACWSSHRSISMIRCDKAVGRVDRARHFGALRICGSRRRTSGYGVSSSRYDASASSRRRSAAPQRGGGPSASQLGARAATSGTNRKCVLIQSVRPALEMPGELLDDVEIRRDSRRCEVTALDSQL
jgi:hypothetical protein